MVRGDRRRLAAGEGEPRAKAGPAGVGAELLDECFAMSGPGAPETWHPAGVGFFNWLYRLPGRLNRSVEKTALASSVENGGNPGPQSNLAAVQSSLGSMEGDKAGEGDSADSESR